MAVQGRYGDGDYPHEVAAARPSNADRYRAVDMLSAGFAEGRLDGDEHGRRVEEVLRATSYERLYELTRDLPAGPFPLPYASAGYPQPYDQYPAPYYPGSRPVDGLAIAALVCVLVAPFVMFVPAIVGVVFGHVTLSRHPTNDGSSRGLAIAALILGYLQFVGIVFVLGIVLLLVMAS